MKALNFDKLIIGFNFNSNGELPLEFIRSFQQFHSNDTQLILFVNFNTTNFNFGKNITIQNLGYVESKPYKISKKLVEKFGYSRIFRASLASIRLFLKLNIIFFKSIPRFSIPILTGIYPINVVRFFFFLNFFRKIHFKHCFVTDTSDVVFQGNVFEKGIVDKTYAFAENKRIEIRNEPFNFSWVSKLYGKSPYFTELVKQEVYCCGTILFGSHQSATNFLKPFLIDCLKPEMAQSYSGNQTSKQTFSFKNPYDAAEQGVFNKMVFLRQVPFECKENGDLVYTIGSEPREDIGLDEHFIFKKSNPIVPAVVHQYNRHSDLLDFVKKKYGV